MRNLVKLISFSLAFCPAVWAAANNPYSAKLQAKAPAQKLRVLPSAAPKEAGVWKPSTALRSNWNGMAWKEYAKYTFTYDSEGRAIKELAENMDKTQTQYYPFSLVERTFDELGRQVAEKVSAGFSADKLVPVSELEIIYDPVLEDFVAEQNAYDILEDGTKEMNAYSYKQVVERDKEGNVLSMHALTWYEGDFMEVLSVENTYGDDGKIKSILESELTQEEEGGPLELKPTEFYDNCVWFNTDGQIVSLDDITSANNRLHTAKVESAGQSDIAMSIEYPEDGEYDFISKAEYQYLTFLPTVSVTSHKSLEYGGYYTKIVTDQDLTAAGAYPVQSIDQVLCQYDQYGNLLELNNRTFYGHDIINSWIKGTVENGEDGFPSTYLRQEYKLQDGNDYYGTWEDVYQLKYDGWKEVSAVEKVTEESDAPVEYYDLTGRKVTEPSNGLFIRKQGSKSIKVIL